MSRHYGRWTEEEIERLLELDKMKETDANIGKVLGRTEASIRSKLSLIRSKDKVAPIYEPPQSKSMWQKFFGLFS